MSNRAALRIGVVTARAFPMLGGIESHVDEVTARLVADGYDVTVLTTDLSHTEPAKSERNGATVLRFRAWPRKRDYYASPRLFMAILRSKFDLIHIQGVHTLVPPLAMLAAILRRTPFVLTFHTGGSSNALRQRLRTTQFRLLSPLLRRAAALVAVSEYEAQLFERVMKRSRSIAVIRNGGMTLPSSQVTGVVPGRVVSIGRLERYKGHHRAIEALPQLIARNPQTHLRILGSGPYEPQLRLLAEQLGVSDRVEIDFVPPHNRAEMATALGQAAVVSLLSEYESHPVAVIEALAMGRPVVVLDNSGLTELIAQDWVLGVSNDASTDEIATVLGDQLDAPRQVRADTLPTWADCVGQLEALYESLARVASAR